MKYKKILELIAVILSVLILTGNKKNKIKQYTKLPTVYISTQSGEKITDKTVWQEGKIKILMPDGKEELSETRLKIKGRGNSTWTEKKKSYSIKLETEHEILGMKNHKSWVLCANYLDRSMIRNRFSSYIANNVFNSTWNAQFKPVNLYLNNQFCGTYDLGEKIKINKNRVNLGDGGFIAEIDYRNGEENHFYSEIYHLPFNLKEPGELSFRQYDFAKQIINNAEKVLASDSFDKWFSEVIDVNSFADWYLLNEFAKNTDAVFQTSVYMYYNPSDQKLYLGPSWDFDLAFGNFYGYENPKGFYVHGGKKWNNDDLEQKSLSNDDFFHAYWINRLFEAPEFKSLVKKRWMEKSGELYKAVIEIIPEYASQIAPEIPLNEKIYPRLGQHSWNGPEGYDTRKTYQSEVDYLYNWCLERYDWMDREIRRW